MTIEMLPNVGSTPSMGAISYSRLAVFEKCPYQAYLKFVIKREVEGGEDPKFTEAKDRGTKIHQLAEDWVRGETAEGDVMDEALPKPLQKFPKEFAELREAYMDGTVQLEGDWGYDRDWCQTGWFDPDVWLRVKLDYCKFEDDLAEVGDYKTGKKMGNEVAHMGQGHLYTLATLMRHPEIKVVRFKFLYLDHGPHETLSRTLTREKAMKLLPRWDKRLKTASEATMFPAKPNKITCAICPYGAARGDKSCPYGVEL